MEYGDLETDSGSGILEGSGRRTKCSEWDWEGAYMYKVPRLISTLFLLLFLYIMRLFFFFGFWFFASTAFQRVCLPCLIFPYLIRRFFPFIPLRGAQVGT